MLAIIIIVNSVVDTAASAIKMETNEYDSEGINFIFNIQYPCNI